MRVVLYANDFEPITVLELDVRQMQFIEKHRMINLPVITPPQTRALSIADRPTLQTIKMVTIYPETFVRNGQKHTMLFTRDEESALLLKCAFLPGQQSGLQERERKAYFDGVLFALSRIGM